MSRLDVRVFNSIGEIDPEIWDRIVAGRGFQSHRWYQFGERAMADSPPTYLIAWEGDTPIASAALFKVKNEPLPLPAVARRFMASILKRRPLLVCRSPLADTSALLLPGEPLRDEALNVLAWEAVIALGILIVFAPFALVGLAAWLGRRLYRRHEDERLLAT